MLNYKLLDTESHFLLSLPILIHVHCAAAAKELQSCPILGHPILLNEQLVTQIPFAWMTGMIPRWNLRDQPSGHQWKGRELDGSLSKLPSCPFSYQEQD